MTKYFQFVVQASSGEEALKQLRENPLDFLCEPTEHVKFIVIGQHTWGRGDTLEEAYEQNKLVGGSKKDVLLAYKFVSTLAFSNANDDRNAPQGEAYCFVDSMGSTCWCCCDRFSVPLNDKFTHYAEISNGQGRSHRIWVYETARGYTAANGWQFDKKGVGVTRRSAGQRAGTFLDVDSMIEAEEVAA